MKIAMMVLSLLLGGCVNIRIATSPVDTTVKAADEGSSCVPSLLGFSFGTTSYDDAKSNGGIQKVRNVEYERIQFLLFGQDCTIVVGENGMTAKSQAPSP